MKKIGVLLVAALAACGLALCLSACGGSSDPNVGMYEGTTVEVLGEEMPMSDIYDEGENYLELKDGGKCTWSIDGSTIDGTWEVDGTDITISVSENGTDYDSTGTIEEGVIKVDFVGMGIPMTFEKAE